MTAIGTYQDVKTVVIRQNIPIFYHVPKVIEGWYNKPKGMLQILYERGFIPPSAK